MCILSLKLAGLQSKLYLLKEQKTYMYTAKQRKILQKNVIISYYKLTKYVTLIFF